MIKQVFFRCPFIFLFAILTGLWIIGCTAPKEPPSVIEKPSLVIVDSKNHPDFADDINFSGLKQSITHSLLYLKNVPSTKTFKFGRDVYSADHMIKSLQRFIDFLQSNPLQQELKDFIEDNYLVYQANGNTNKGSVFFTGYYEPILIGSLTKSDAYSVPVYGLPDDLITIDLSLFSSEYKKDRIIGRLTGNTVIPYYERRDIEEQGAVITKAKILVWLKDEIDLFFLQIQGSGKIYTNDGNWLNIHYHTTNGHPYRSIGKLLIESDKVPKTEMSMQRIRSYLTEHPDEIRTILNYNKSYVFFKIEEEGPLGCLDFKLTAGRSLAADRLIFPLPALSFIQAKKPLVDGDGSIHKWIDFNRFVLLQDTGGAIKGPGRADLFWGNGNYAEIAAGHMQHLGKLFCLVLKPEKI